MKNLLVVVLCILATMMAWIGFDLGRKSDDIGYKIGAMLPCVVLASLATWIGRKKPGQAGRERQRRRSRDDRDYDDEREDRPRRPRDDREDRPRRRRR
jgi:hypothetical protein